MSEDTTLVKVSEETKAKIPKARKGQDKVNAKLLEKRTVFEEKGIIFVNTAVLDQIKEEAGKLVATPDAELALLKLIELEELAEDLMNYAKEKLGDKMDTLLKNCNKIESELVVVSRKAYGSKYSVKNEQLAEQAGVGSFQPKFKLDSKAVEAHLKEHGGLPDGVELRQRTKTVSINRRKKK